MESSEEANLTYSSFPPSTHITTAAVIIFQVELIFLLLSNFTCLFFIVLLGRIRCFHQNLRLLLGNFAISFLLLTVSRYFILTAIFAAFYFDADVAGKDSCRLAKGLHDVSAYVSGLSLFVLVLERSIATACVRDYERKKTPLLGATLVLFQWFIAGFVVAASQSENEALRLYLPCQREYMSSGAITGSYITILVADLLSFLIFLSLLYYNKRRYQQTAQDLARHELSERYQIAENVRTTRLLYPLVLAYLVTSCLVILVLLITALRKRAGLIPANQIGSAGSEYSHLFDVLVAVYAFVFPLLATYGHDSLVREFRRVLCGRTLSTDVGPTSQPRSLIGRRPLAMDTEREREFHFEHLDLLWNNVASH